jgi:hypothetical protein
MNSKEVWEVINKEDVPKGRRTIKCKWIFKIKRNGIFQARLDLGFAENKSDRCLLSKRIQTNIMIIEIYVDDCLVLGKDKDINKLIDYLELKSSFYWT